MHSFDKIGYLRDNTISFSYDFHFMNIVLFFVL